MSSFSEESSSCRILSIRSVECVGREKEDDALTIYEYDYTHMHACMHVDVPHTFSGSRVPRSVLKHTYSYTYTLGYCRLW